MTIDASANETYIGRESAVAADCDDAALIQSNISPDSEERAAFWDLVTRHERKPGRNCLSLPNGYSEAVRQFHESGKASLPVEKALSALRESENPAQKIAVAADKKELKAVAKACEEIKIHPARGGRVQHRMLRTLDRLVKTGAT